MIKILIADDSKTETLLLKSIFESAPDLKVIGCAKNGKEAIELAALLKPDIITVDIEMPIINGLEAIKTIMMHNPIPIVVISSRLNDVELNATYNAFEVGALSVLEKPTNVNSPEFDKLKNKIITTIRSMAEIKVIKRRFFLKKKSSKIFKSIPYPDVNRPYELIAIGASTGGPQAIKMILKKLPNNFPVPIVIVQHMTNGYIEGFTNWLNNNIDLSTKNVSDYEHLKPGMVYFAPDNYHLIITRVNNNLVARLTDSPAVSGFKPSITVLIESVARVCKKNAIGLLLTGMGNDGADGLLALKKANGHTIIQDQKSSVVFGMPGVAQSLGAVDKVVDLEDMADYLMAITKKKPG